MLREFERAVAGSVTSRIATDLNVVVHRERSGHLGLVIYRPCSQLEAPTQCLRVLHGHFDNLRNTWFIAGGINFYAAGGIGVGRSKCNVASRAGYPSIHRRSGALNGRPGAEAEHSDGQ